MAARRKKAAALGIRSLTALVIALILNPIRSTSAAGGLASDELLTVEGDEVSQT